jgi:uncharacterized membrane protein
MKGLPPIAACVTAALLLVPPAYAQQVDPGDKILVTDRAGVQTEGRLLRFSPAELRLLVDGTERVIAPSGIGRIEKRDSLWNGMLIGAVPFALLVGAAAGTNCEPICGEVVPIAMLLGGVIGAGGGAFADWRIQGYSIVDGPPLGSPNGGSPGRVNLPGELWRSVRQGDTISVVTSGGQSIKGKFAEASSTSVALIVDGRRREIPSTDVRRVTRKGNRYRSGALWSGAVFGTAGFFSSVSCSTGDCGPPILGALWGVSGGALLGALVGAAIPKHPVIYEAAAGAPPAVRLTPVLGRDRVGIALSATF